MVDIGGFKAGVTYTDIDLNTNAATEIYNHDGDAAIYGVYMENGGSTAEVNLEVTDGTDTAVLAQPGAGGSVEFGETVVFDNPESLQINVTTVEGAAQTNTCVVFHGE